MKVLVSGGGGYLGSVLVRQLIERGHGVVVLDRFFWGMEPLKGLPIEFHHGDIRDWKDKWLTGIDAVCHLAGLSNDPCSEFDPQANWEMNAVASERLALACQEKGIRRITFASSASIYDAHDMGDGSPVLRHEDDPVSPRGAYSTSKYHAEKALLEVGATILRQGTVYGYSHRMRVDLVCNTFVRDALLGRSLTLHSGGSMWRPLVDVEDCARAHIEVLEAPFSKVGGEVFNVVGGNHQIRELAGIIAGAFAVFYGGNRHVGIEYSGASPAIVRNYRISGEKIEKAIGFSTKGSVFGSATDMLERLSTWSVEELLAPQYQNIRWMKLLEGIYADQRGFDRIGVFGSECVGAAA